MRFRWFATFDVILLAYVALSIWLASIHGLEINYFDFTYGLLFLANLALCMWLYATWIAFRERISGRDTLICGKSWRSWMRRNVFNRQVGWDYLRALIYLKLMFAVYANIKQAIPRLHAHVYDESLRKIDQALHFGVDPINLVHRVFSADWSVMAMDELYVAWYGILPPVLTAFLLTERWKMKQSFLTAFFLMWIVGGLIAVAVPSLGPIFVWPELFEHLSMPRARVLQEMLWTHYQDALAHPEKYKVLAYEGIAAFPSLHVGVVALIAFFMMTLNRWLGWLMAAYTAVIQIGSVLLGWHYAIDGYAMILLAGLLFWSLRPRREPMTAGNL